MSKEGKNQTSNIETAEELEIVYPVLVSAVRDEMIREVETWTAKEVKEKLPELYERIAAGIGPGKRKADLSKPGFLLEKFEAGERGKPDSGDPFAAGTLRCYLRLKNLGIGTVELPFVLAFDDVFSRASLENYIQRAEGGGDYVRAKAARLAMERCK